MAKSMMHLAQFLVHGPTYHSLAMWRHPRTAAAGYDWARPELYQHIAKVCQRCRFDMVFFAHLQLISDTYTGSLAPAIRTLPRRPRHHPLPLLSFMAAATTHIGLGAAYSVSHGIRSMPRGRGRRSITDARTRGLERRHDAEPQPVGQLRRGAAVDRRALRPRA